MWPPRWKKIAAEAKESFQYMLEHDLIQGDHMDHFRIHHANLHLSSYSRKFHNAYRAEVEQLMIPWIREEEKSGRLKDRQQWRPFRDEPDYDQSIMGYHHLFVYHPTWIPIHPHMHQMPFGHCEPPSNEQIPCLLRIFFMLGIVNQCLRPNDCATCEKDLSSGCNPNFVAAIYGWEENDTPFLKPYAHIERCEKEEINLHMPLVPAAYWNRSGDDAIYWNHSDSDSDSLVE